MSNKRTTTQHRQERSLGTSNKYQTYDTNDLVSGALIQVAIGYAHGKPTAAMFIGNATDPVLLDSGFLFAVMTRCANQLQQNRDASMTNGDDTAGTTDRLSGALIRAHLGFAHGAPVVEMFIGNAINPICFELGFLVAVISSFD